MEADGRPRGHFAAFRDLEPDFVVVGGTIRIYDRRRDRSPARPVPRNEFATKRL